MFDLLNAFVVLYNNSLNDCSLGKLLILFPSNPNVSFDIQVFNIGHTPHIPDLCAPYITQAPAMKANHNTSA